MGFQIQSIRGSHGSIGLSMPVHDEGNVFTMLVGRNAIGKTRTLGKLSNAYVFSGERLRSEIQLVPRSRQVPSKVITLSNSRFDRFPDSFQAKRNPERSDIEYRYLGLSGWRGGIGTILNPSIASMLSELSGPSKRGINFSEILDYLGFLPMMDLELRRSFQRGTGPYMLEDEVERALQVEFGGNVDELVGEAFRSLSMLERYFKNARGFPCQIEFSRSGALHFDDKMGRDFSVLLRAGVLRVGSLTLINKATKDKVPFGHASSGQQCMLLMFLGLAGAMSNDALICIDEPEISLHPKWQSEFIGLLQAAFSSYKGCHFVIATHSPQIVAGLRSKNGFVSDLARMTLVASEEYAMRSADFQLTEVFHEPGFKNEYLIRILLTTLSKLSRGQELSDEDHKRIDSIEQMEGRLDVADPVLHLLSQIKMIAK